MDAIFNRTSVRKYKKESLKKEEIDLILKAAFSAPSARNSQPWQFIVVENCDFPVDLFRSLICSAQIGCFPFDYFRSWI